ncbi:hypothetical protein [Phaeodactylibacter xiamenensis]|jgi:hypothetical protein|uniref:hypothetical protein n=1 Tax=Phaeodactylibacter xiamenensis TaxID=1524460 RepID=UPI0024A86882|nr:hypothetical protein [Phaeodactylibacter xiamenensis]
MKYPTLFTLCILATTLLQAQHEALFDDVSSFGAFGGPILEFSSINGQLVADVGGGGAIILDEFFIGGYGMGTDYPEVSFETEIDGELTEIDADIDFGHGGLWFGYVRDIEQKMHLYSSLKVGWGRADLEHDIADLPSDRLFVLTPEIGIELNMTRFFRIGLTGGYRIVNGVSRLPGLDNQDFSSPTVGITFRFGGFGSYWDWD